MSVYFSVISSNLKEDTHGLLNSERENKSFKLMTLVINLNKDLNWELQIKLT